MRLRLLAPVVLSIAVVAQGIPSPAAAATRSGVPSAATPTLPSPGGGGKYVAPSPGVRSAPSRALPAPRIVDVRTIAKRGRQGAIRPSWLQTPTLASPGGGGKYSSSYASASGPQAVEASSLVAGLSLSDNYALYGNDQLVEPPDAQLAASPAQLVEVAGATMAILASDGSVQWSIDLHAMFQLSPNADFVAPSLQYDYSSSRWLLGGAGNDFTTRSARLFLAVSRTANPFGPWSVTVTGSRDDIPHQCVGGVTCPNSDFFLRESLAVTTDKVVQAYQVVSCQSGCNWNRAGAFIVMRKDHLLAAVRPTMDMFWLAPNQSDFMAVQVQSNFSDAYLVWLKVGDPSVTTLSPDRLGLLEILGLPYPDPAYSYRGTTTVYRQGQVDVAINDGCGPNNCIRLMKISNFGYGTVVAKDSFSQYAPYNPVMNREVPDLEKTIGLGGANLFDGSLAIDPYGDLFMSAAYSSSTRNPGIAVTGIRSPVSSASTLMPVSPIVESPNNYVSCGTSSNSPWGAYMRAMPDPNNWTHVWVPGEVSLGSCDWATVIASVTMGIGPQAAKMSPTFGSIKGGQMVEIDGSFFVPNANQVLFGSTPGTVVAESSTVIFVSAPPGVAGPVGVTLQTPDGAASLGTFTYITPGVVATPPPSGSGRYWR